MQRLRSSLDEKRSDLGVILEIEGERQ